MNAVLSDNLGDGVLVRWDGFAFVLAIDKDGADEIVLEPLAVAKLFDFVERCRRETGPHARAQGARHG
jgi:hypothetical protein